MIYDFTKFDFRFNKNGNFFVKYDGTLLRRPSLVSACEVIMTLLKNRFNELNSQNEIGTKYLVYDFVPAGFTYKELKAFLFVAVRDYVSLLDCGFDLLPAYSDTFARLQSDFSRYLGHIPTSFVYEFIKKEKVIEAARVTSFAGSIVYVCVIGSRAFWSFSEAGLKREIKKNCPELALKYSIKIKVLE